MKKVAIVQSNYIPWKGYFDIIHDVDLFVFYDDVQFTTRDWRNRNKLKVPTGTLWLTIPVGADTNRLIHQVTITDDHWALNHWKTIVHLYSKAPYYKKYKELFAHIYLEKKWDRLSEVNQYMICAIARELNIRTKFEDSRCYNCNGVKSDRLLSLLRQVDAGLYMSGPAAANYIEENCFAKAGIQLIYKDYSGYPEYPQFHPPFTHGVSILDLLFHTGPDAPYYIWGWREGSL